MQLKRYICCGSPYLAEQQMFMSLYEPRYLDMLCEKKNYF